MTLTTLSLVLACTSTITTDLQQDPPGPQGSNGDGGGAAGDGGGAPGDGGGGAGDGGGGAGDGGGAAGDGGAQTAPSGCGESTSSRFYLASFQMLIDPVDFADESWDWDGGGIADFWDEYSWMIELLATGFGYEGAYTTAEMLIPYADELAPILASPYVSPDPMVEQWACDTSDCTFAGEDWFDDDQNLVEYRDAEVRFTNDDDFLWLDLYDRDLVVDDYVGGEYLDRPLLRALADCGPVVFVYTDRQMSTWETRIRAVGFEIESW